VELTISQEIALLAYSVNCWRYYRTPNLSLYLVAAAMTQLLIERRAYLTADKRVVVVMRTLRERTRAIGSCASGFNGSTTGIELSPGFIRTY
jgi:hypothetical protein